VQLKLLGKSGYEGRMLMKLWQMLVFTAVIFWFIWLDTEEDYGYAPAIIAGGMSWLLSVGVIKFYDFTASVAAKLKRSRF
jgi:hypothetical protein